MFAYHIMYSDYYVFMLISWIFSSPLVYVFAKRAKRYTFFYGKTIITFITRPSILWRIHFLYGKFIAIFSFLKPWIYIFLFKYTNVRKLNLWWCATELINRFTIRSQSMMFRRFSKIQSLIKSVLFSLSQNYK